MSKEYDLYVDTTPKRVVIEPMRGEGYMALHSWDEVDTLISDLEEASETLWGLRVKEEV